MDRLAIKYTLDVTTANATTRRVLVTVLSQASCETEVYRVPSRPGIRMRTLIGFYSTARNG